MYYAFIRHQIRKNFAGLGKSSASSGDNLSRNVEHVFAGDSAIGGTRHGPEAFERWLARVYRLLPDLSFEVQDIIVSGGPFDTRVAVHWRSRATTVAGDPYVNDGVHLIGLSKGKITKIRVLTDTVVIERTMAAIAAKGVAEAAEPPVITAPISDPHAPTHPTRIPALR